MADAATPPLIVHILASGQALCGQPDVPAGWPPNHRWVWGADFAEATCRECLRVFESRRPMPRNVAR